MRRRWTRRAVLRAMGGALMALDLAACTSSAPPTGAGGASQSSQPAPRNAAAGVAASPTPRVPPSVFDTLSSPPPSPIASPGSSPDASRPISLHPENPRYFLFRGQPTALITSGERYGAVLNTAFDYLPYLDELHAHGFNLTRIYTGAYVEKPGVEPARNIPQTSLAPTSPEHFLAPWPRSSTPGAADGGNKFNLSRWDVRYFERLKDFVAQAGQRGIVVEITLFAFMRNEAVWSVSPLNVKNNINNVGDVPPEQVHTQDNQGLLGIQEELTRKIVRELSHFDNVYYEIVDEPYLGPVDYSWQDQIMRVIHEAEVGNTRKHLIAQNVLPDTGQAYRILPGAPNEAVSIINYHAPDPNLVALNYHLSRVIALDTTGGYPVGDPRYRTDGWEFLLSGGAVYNNLDLSFSTEHERGTLTVPNGAPAGGSQELRRQLKVLRDFVASLDFVQMRPNDSVIVSGVPDGAVARALAQNGTQYAIYVKQGRQASLVLNIPAGSYREEWVNPSSGQIEKSSTVAHDGGQASLASPPYTEDIALRLTRLS